MIADLILPVFFVLPSAIHSFDKLLFGKMIVGYLQKVKICILFFCIILAFGNVGAQTELQKWSAKEVSYELPTNTIKNFSLDTSGIGLTILSVFRNIYYFTISDLDGDNCPFTPSCSTFFLESIKETNILQGILMFSDRFTRDMNLFKGNDHYHLNKDGKFIDPPYNYTLNLHKIKL